MRNQIMCGASTDSRVTGGGHSEAGPKQETRIGRHFAAQGWAEENIVLCTRTQHSVAWSLEAGAVEIRSRVTNFK
jgi:hypothetical protein